MRVVVILNVIRFFINGILSTSKIKDDEFCGTDNSRDSRVKEGISDLMLYPWLGMLYYPMGCEQIGSTVVLVTAQTCLTSAYELEKLPKKNFRTQARVTFGRPCGQNEITIRQYAYHPDFKQNIHTALALIQLETDHIKFDLTPICPAPEVFLPNPEFYAFNLFAGCGIAKVKVYKMQYLRMKQCVNSSRRSDLDVGKWPSEAACAQSISEDENCLWRSGTILAVKQYGYWRMLGFSISGPGCDGPSRFLDYGRYYKWVQRSLAKIGSPAISRVAPNRVVMRRSFANIQRFGPCDVEEMRSIIYSERQRYQGGPYIVAFNVTLYSQMEYACITVNADASVDYDPFPEPLPYYQQTGIQWVKNPNIRIRRWCTGPPKSNCYGFQFSDIHFEVIIEFTTNLFLNFTAYGQGDNMPVMSPHPVLRWDAQTHGVRPYMPTVTEVKNNFRKYCHRTPWHYIMEMRRVCYKGAKCPP